VGNDEQRPGGRQGLDEQGDEQHRHRTTAPEKDHVLVREKEKTYTFVPRRFAGAP
jgi:hypothetical protein